MAIQTSKTHEVSKETQLWLISLANAQIIMENQGALEYSNKYRRKLKQVTKMFIEEVNKAMMPDILAIFNEDEETSQIIIDAAEKLTKLSASLDITKMNRVINFIEKNKLHL